MKEVEIIYIYQKDGFFYIVRPSSMSVECEEKRIYLKEWLEMRNAVQKTGADLCGFWEISQ